MRQIFGSFDFGRQKQIRKAVVATSCFMVLLTLGAVVARLIKNQTQAITEDGANVSVTAGAQYNYGSWSTHKYTIATDSGNITGFCVEPKKASPTGTYKSNVASNTTKNKKIKLALWAYSSNTQTAKNLMRTLASGQDFAENNYAFIHALVGYIYTGGNDTSGLSASEIAYIQDASAFLAAEIDGDSDAWVYAKGFRLYELDNVPSSLQNIMWIENNRQYSSIEAHKCDTLNNSCTPTGSANFSGVTFTLIYNGQEGAYDGHRSTIYRQGMVVATKTTGNDGIARFENIPLGKYIVAETDSTNPALILNAQEISVNANNPEVVFFAHFENVIVRGDLLFRKHDDSGNPMANIPFRIKSNTTGESHIVVSNQEGIVYTGQYLHSNHTNGYDSMGVNSITDLGYGTWFGLDGNAQTPIDNNLGALPYDTYTITEIACTNNDHCYDIESQTKTLTVNRVDLFDLGVWENDCVDFSLNTTATDNEDGDKIISSKQNAEIKDRVDYCVKKNTEYRLVGTLVYAGTGQPVTGAGTTQEMTINPGNTECNHADMVFTFDARALAGQDVVVYERIYKTGDNTNPVVSHDDPNSAPQTVSVFSLKTVATDANDDATSVAAKSIEDLPDQRIKDTVDYCLKKNISYTLKGILMDKETGEKLTVNGETFEKTIAITPSDNCGRAELVFDVDASELKGKRIVVYEYAYEGDQLVDKHESINDADQTVAVYSLGTKATDVTDDNQSITAETNQTIKDSVEFCLTKNKTYTLKGVLMDKESREKVLIDGEPVEKSLSIIPSNDCGIAELDFDIDATEFAGRQIVVFETVYEGDEEIIRHEDFEDEDQTIDIYSIDTTASDPADGDKDVLGATETKIKDTIDYCLTAGKEYTIKGILMDKDTKRPLPVNGSFVESSVTFTPTENCGSIEMEFTLDASHLNGIEIVVFESVYLGDDLVIEHKDIEDEAQAVYIYIPPPTPNTGLFTNTTTAGEQDSVSSNALPVAIVIVITLAGLGIGCGFFLKHKSVKFN